MCQKSSRIDIKNLKKLIIFFALLLVGFCDAKTAPDNHEKPILEVVIFHSKPTISQHTVLMRARAASPLLETMPGFISRKFGEGNKKGEWVDIIEWDSLANALLATKQVGSRPVMQKFIAPMQDYKMYHFKLHIR